MLRRIMLPGSLAIITKVHWSTPRRDTGVHDRGFYGDGQLIRLNGVDVAMKPYYDRSCGRQHAVSAVNGLAG